MQSIPPKVKRLKERRGAVLPLVAILIFVLLGFAAFAIDLGYLHVVKGELQNAADAGALAGAASLFDSDGNLDRGGATTAAQNATIANNSGGKAVPAPNVEIGHYEFPPPGTTLGNFTPTTANSQLSNWQSLSFACLNCLGGASDCTSVCPSGVTGTFINAVRVTSSRSDVPTFFSKIFGLSSLAVTNVQAVAYIGFAGSLPPDAVNEPIAICQQAIKDPTTGSYSCNVGRMLNSGMDPLTSQTAGWTNFTQPCSTGSNSSVRQIIQSGESDPNCTGSDTSCCLSGNPSELLLGQGIGGTNGTMDSSLQELYDVWQNCYENGRNPWQPWVMTLPVIDCSSATCPSNLNNCPCLVGAVDISVVWIFNQLNNNTNAPTQMGNAPQGASGCTDTDPQTGTWKCSSECGASGSTCEYGSSCFQCCWNSFATCFKLQNADGTPAIAQQKTMYFLTSCTPHDPEGATGGANFGVMAKYPVLVK